MSTYWGYRCKQDGATSNTEFNHGEKILRSCVKCYPLVKQIYEQDDSGYIEVQIMAHNETEVWGFLSDHYEHGVELYNEYGESEPIEKEQE